MKRVAFYHRAYELYADLLRDGCALLPLWFERKHALLAKRFVELDREAHARRSNPYYIDAVEADRTRARLAAVGLDVALPEAVAEERWQWLQRVLARLELLRDVGAPLDLVGYMAEGPLQDLGPQPYEPPIGLDWSRASDLARDIAMVAAATRDDVGIGDRINAVPEAFAFFKRFPDAYSVCDDHAVIEVHADLDLPDPTRYPADIWSATAITLATPFAEIPCGSAGHATIQPVDVPPAVGRLHPLLVAACESARRRGYDLLGFVEMRMPNRLRSGNSSSRYRRFA